VQTEEQTEELKKHGYKLFQLLVSWKSEWKPDYVCALEFESQQLSVTSAGFPNGSKNTKWQFDKNKQENKQNTSLYSLPY